MIAHALQTNLPVIKTLQDCADWSKTVAPYLPELYTLPQQVVANIGDTNALKALYLSMNPLISALGFALYVLAPGVLIASEIERNYSEVDRLWSFLPVLYNCHYALWAHLHGLPTQRLDHVVAVSVLWGARLTFNYARKGGYSLGSEDYRWARVKSYIGPFWMFLLNVTFISFAQSVRLHAHSHSLHFSLID
jgi:steroid 5-alpha reductase family enzyme